MLNTSPQRIQRPTSNGVSLLKRSALFLLTLVLIVSVLWLRPAWTPSITEPDSIASLEQVELNGSLQWILARGKNRSKPVLLFLHGGPGMPAMYLAHAATRELEQDFVMVRWERRDASESFNTSMPADEERVST